MLVRHEQERKGHGGALVLSCHFAVVSKLVFFVNSHNVCLCSHHHHVVTVFVVAEHGAIVNAKAMPVAVYIFPAVGVHEDTETLDPIAAEDTENFALVVVELCRRFPAKGEEVFTQEGLDAGQRKMGQAGAVVQKSVDALISLAKSTLHNDEINLHPRRG